MKNPRDGDLEAIRQGAEYFRTRGCADCHGLDAKGIRGPDLTGLWEAGASEDRLFQTIRRGVPGSEMPATNGPDEDIWAVLAYLHTLDTPVTAEAVAGNAGNGQQIFSTKCRKLSSREWLWWRPGTRSLAHWRPPVAHGAHAESEKCQFVYYCVRARFPGHAN